METPRPTQAPIHKETDTHLYIRKSEGSAPFWKDLSVYAKAIGKKIWDMDEDVESFILKNPKHGYGLVRKRRIRISKEELEYTINHTLEPSQHKLARILGIHRNTISRLINKYNLQPLIDAQLLYTIEQVENKLITMAKDGDIKAIKLFLEAKAKKQGYGAGNAIPDANLNVKLVFLDKDNKESQE